LPSRPETHFASKEKEGPRHELRETRNISPQNQNTASQRSSAPGPAAPGVRSATRRFSLPVSSEQPPVQRQAPSQQTPQWSAPTGMPFSSLPPLPERQPVEAAWADTAPKTTGKYVQPATVVQTAHLVPLEPHGPMWMPSLEPSVLDRYLLKLSADRKDVFFTLFMSLNILAAVGFTYFAVRLLRT